jgi:hypothetical protein
MRTWTKALHAATMFGLNDRNSHIPVRDCSLFQPEGITPFRLGFLRRHGDRVLNFSLSRPAVRARKGNNLALRARAVGRTWRWIGEPCTK